MKREIVIIGLCIIGLFISACTNTDNSPSDTNDDIDLMNCISYYDGCNTCQVVNGEIGGCTKMYCEEYKEPKCLEFKW